jgi:hypothetical protein
MRGPEPVVDQALLGQVALKSVSELDERSRAPSVA